MQTIMCTVCCKHKMPRSFPAIMRKLESWRPPICYYCSKKNKLDNKWRPYPKKATKWRGRSKYGVTQRDIALILDTQKHRCAGCYKHLNDSDHIDHCHTTKKIRGILCGRCNTALGFVKDNPEVLERLAEYLREPPGHVIYTELGMRDAWNRKKV